MPKTEWMKNKRFCVLGLSLSGRACMDVLLREGIEAKACEIKDDIEMQEYAQSLRRKGVHTDIGSNDPKILDGVDILLVSPGIPPDNPVISEAQRRGVVVISELEFGWRLCGAYTIAVSGTNGKSTTVDLIEKVLNCSGIDCVSCGNIGYPITKAATEQEDTKVFVVEVSSFQLFYTSEFKPNISVLLNISEDHFDWHGDINDYIAAKSMICAKQSSEHCIIANYDDKTVRKIADNCRAKKYFYSIGEEKESFIYVSNEAIFIRREDEKGAERKELVLNTKDLFLKGTHNLQNTMACIATVEIMGADMGSAKGAIVNYKGLKHRMEYVGTKSGIEFYDDSKATNPASVAAALTAFEKKIVLILGGKDKGLSFAELAESIRRLAESGRIGGIAIYGEAKDSINADFRMAGIELLTQIELFNEFENAVARAYEMAEEGNAVLLSPGCSSYDQFENFEMRGDVFRGIVNSFADEKRK